MDLQKLFTKENVFKCTLAFVRLLLIGACVGIFVSLFQLCAFHLIDFLKGVYIEHEKTKVIIFICIVPFTCVLSIFLTNINKNINGGGIPQFEHNIEKKQNRINWKKDLPMMFISSLLTFMSFATLGSEGPSVVVAGNSALMVNDLFKEKDDEAALIAAGAGFGCALVSPISGLVYIFEDLLHKVTLKGALKAIIIVAVSAFIGSLIFSHQIVYFQINDYFQFKDYLFAIPCMGLIILFNFVFANIYLEALMKLNDFYKKHASNIFVKYRAVLFYIVTIPLAFYFGEYMSTGSMIINNTEISFAWYLIILLIAFRIFNTFFAATSKVSGGIVIPQFAIGALVGVLIVNLLKDTVPSIHVSLYANEIILLSMISFYVVNMETPLTGISLIFAFTQFKSALNILLPAIIVMYGSHFISKYNKYGNLYDVLKKYL